MTDAVAMQPVVSRLEQHATNIVEPFLGRIYNGSGPGYQRPYSPLILSNQWPKIARLLFMLFCCCFGSTMNGFFVASFFVEHTLKKVGNIFLACAGLADLLITSGVMSVSAVILLSGQWDNVPVCRAVQLVTEAATYAYSLFFLLVAAENFYRICRATAEYEIFISMRIGLMSILIYCLCFGLSAAGVLYSLDYDYCERQFYGNVSFRISTAVLFHGIPTILTFASLFTAILRIRRRAREQIQYKRSQLYEREYSTTALNITAYMLFVVAWIPYLVVVHEFPSVSDSKYYNFVWLGLFRSVFTSFIYGIANRNFRRAYAHLFNYCCCKSTLSASFANRHRRALEFKPATGDVRVHIMHKAFSTSTPCRGASSSRETQEL